MIKKNDLNRFIREDFDKLFKDYSNQFIEDNIDFTDMNLKLFDQAYRFAFEGNTDKHRRFQKCKLKNQYKKFLECGDISQCELKEQLYLISGIIRLMSH